MLAIDLADWDRLGGADGVSPGQRISVAAETEDVVRLYLHDLETDNSWLIEDLGLRERARGQPWTPGPLWPVICSPLSADPMTRASP